MKRNLPLVLSISLCLVLFLSPPALAQYDDGGDNALETAQEENTGGNSQDEAPLAVQNLTVTPPDICYDKLEPEEADDIRAHYANAYDECQRRVAQKEKREEEQAQSPQENTLVPETDRNFVRVAEPEETDSGKKSGNGKQAEDILPQGHWSQDDDK